MKLTGIIYRLQNKVNGKIYIGKTISKFQYRLTKHLSVARNNGKTYIANAIRKYGWDNFTKDIICSCIGNYDDLDALEVYFIQLYQSNVNGYNLTIGGEKLTGKNNPMFGKNHKPISIKKMSKKAKQRLTNKNNHPMFGKTQSEGSNTKNMLSQPNIKPIVCVETRNSI